MNIYEFYTNDELLAIRNLLRTHEGKLLVRFIGDFVNERATRQPINAEAIKGMAGMVHDIKKLPFDIEGVVGQRMNGV